MRNSLTHHIKWSHSAGHEKASAESSAELCGEPGRDGLRFNNDTLTDRKRERDRQTEREREEKEFDRER